MTHSLLITFEHQQPDPRDPFSDGFTTILDLRLDDAPLRTTSALTLVRLEQKSRELIESAIAFAKADAACEN
jgi:hypothetical protein